MRKKILKFILIQFLCFNIPAISFGWGMLGHRIAGQIAYSYLSPRAKEEILKILGTESLAIASNWADFIKSDTIYKYLTVWHHIDFDERMNYTTMQNYLKSDTAKDAYTAITFLIRELKKKSLLAEKKKMYLRLLIHIVEDIHQPLHVSLSGDHGGNDIKLTWFGQPSNLHRVWDEQIIEDQKLSYTEYANAINHTTAVQRKKLQLEPLPRWLYNSYEISGNLRDEMKEPNQKLGYYYIYKHLEIVNDQLVKAGVHLAGLLNQIFS